MAEIFRLRVRSGGQRGAQVADVFFRFFQQVGVALAASYADEPYQLQDFEAWGYPTVGGDPEGNVVIGGTKSYVTSTEVKRLGLTDLLGY